QFDWVPPWSVFLMNAARAVYGRYDARQADDLVGLRKALEGALELHEKWPGKKAEPAGKVGPALALGRPERGTGLGRRRPRRGGSGDICRLEVFEAPPTPVGPCVEPVPERWSAPYPTPQRV